MAQDAGLAFAQNLVNRFMRFKAQQFQVELFKRREQRYERQLQENRLYRQRFLDIQEQKLATPFTRGKVATAIGGLKSGGEKTMMGHVIDFRSQEDAVDYMLRQLGPNWMEYAPETIDIINKQFPDEPPLVPPATPTSMFPSPATPSPERGLFGLTPKTSALPKETETPVEDEVAMFESLARSKAPGETEVAEAEEKYVVDDYPAPENKKAFDYTYGGITSPREKQRYIDRFWRPKFGRSFK